MIRWRAPLRVELPRAWAGPGGGIRMPVAPLSRTARALALGIPVVLAFAGGAMAVIAAILAERDDTEAIGTLGVELGAAMWFGGVLTLGARRGATVARAVGLAGLALAGALLVALALLLDATGATLALAMEFGVGAVAIAVIDVVLLGSLYGGLTALGDTADTAVTLRLTREPPFVHVGRDLHT